ncbi:ParA family protein [Zhihengliuella halotolerans]|nr:ParA family protein [Zhihengliuella halotolerans]
MGNSVATEPVHQQLEARVRNIMDTMDDSTPLASQLVNENMRRERLKGRGLPKPDRTRYFTISNQKGGVGKTTTTVNVAAALAQSGLNVLVVDIDPQGNASTALGIEHHSEIDSIYDVLINDLPLQDVVAPCPDLDNLVVAPATIDLAGAEIELVSLVAREQRLRRALDQYATYRDAEGMDRLDYVFIDCPPSLGLLTVNAFVAAREVLIPIQCEYYALEGLSQLLKNIEMIQKHLNADLVVSTILLTMYDGRTNLAAQVAQEVRNHFPNEVLEAVIPRSVRISEAPSYQQSVITYDRSSTGALSYMEASTEIADRGVAKKT